MRKSKKLAAEITAVLLLLLGICTLLSGWIEEVMAPEVQMGRFTAGEDGLTLLPPAALVDHDGSPAVAELDEGEKDGQRITRFTSVTVSEVLPDGSVSTDTDTVICVSASTKPLKNRQPVVLLNKLPGPEALRASIPMLSVLIVWLLVCLALLVPAARLVGALVEGSAAPLRGLLLLLCCGALVFGGLALILPHCDIPNQFLPPNHIFDFSFYYENWGNILSYNP